MIEGGEQPISFAAAILYLSEKYNFSVTSWIRSIKRNEAVGGMSNSKHLEGLAVDCVLDDVLQGKDFIAAARALGLQAVDEHNHIHLEKDAPR